VLFRAFDLFARILRADTDGFSGVTGCTVEVETDSGEFAEIASDISTPKVEFASQGARRQLNFTKLLPKYERGIVDKIDSSRGGQEHRPRSIHAPSRLRCPVPRLFQSWETKRESP